MMTQEQAIQNMHRMAFEQAKDNCLEDSWDSIWGNDFRMELFIAEDEGKRLCLWVTIFLDDAIHYDVVDLFNAPELLFLSQPCNDPSDIPSRVATTFCD